MEDESEDDGRAGPGIYVAALLLVAAPVLGVGWWMFRARGPVQSAKCSSRAAKKCEVDGDCVAVQVAPCKMDSVAGSYAEVCENAPDREARAEHGRFRKASRCGTDWADRHAECHGGRCVLAPGF